jgi:hypothetical protein
VSHYLAIVGRLLYGSDGQSLDIDDRALAHLRVVFMNKLRRAEPFLFHHTEPHGHRSLWIHPAVPIVFHFYGSRKPAMNRAWVEHLMNAASGPHGLSVLPEPPAPASTAAEDEPAT